MLCVVAGMYVSSLSRFYGLSNCPRACSPPARGFIPQSPRGACGCRNDRYHYVRRFSGAHQQGYACPCGITYVNGEVWVPKRETFTASARLLLLKGFHQVGDSIFTNYKKFTTDSRIIDDR